MSVFQTNEGVLESAEHSSSDRIPGLKINRYLPQVMRLVQDNAIVGIVAPTGTGKTVGVPPCLSISLKSRVWVTVPTRSATSIWNWVGQHYPQLSLGMAANGVKTYDSSTSVAYVTTGEIQTQNVELILTVYCSPP